MTKVNNTAVDELEQILLRFASSEMDEIGVQQGAISKNTQLFTLDQTISAIQAHINKTLSEIADELEGAKKYPDHDFYGQYAHNQGNNTALDTAIQIVRGASSRKVEGSPDDKLTIGGTQHE